MRTPSSISLSMTPLDSLNMLSRVSSQWNGMPGFSSSLNGSIQSAVAKAYETWLTRPNQERMSVVLAGVGKWLIASWYFLQGRTLVSVISKPVNSTVSAPKTNLSGLRVISWCPQRSGQVTAGKKLSVRLSAQSRVSSMHLVLFGMWETSSSNRLE